MAATRYINSSEVPQPIRKILPSVMDILHPYKMGERIDGLAGKYYNDQTLGYIIMAANPEYQNEFEVPFGVDLRIPYPLQRVFDSWMINKEI